MWYLKLFAMTLQLQKLAHENGVKVNCFFIKLWQNLAYIYLELWQN